MVHVFFFITEILYLNWIGSFAFVVTNFVENNNAVLFGLMPRWFESRLFKLGHNVLLSARLDHRLIVPVRNCSHYYLLDRPYARSHKHGLVNFVLLLRCLTASSTLLSLANNFLLHRFLSITFSYVVDCSRLEAFFCVRVVQAQVRTTFRRSSFTS